MNKTILIIAAALLIGLSACNKNEDPQYCWDCIKYEAIVPYDYQAVDTIQKCDTSPLYINIINNLVLKENDSTFIKYKCK